MMNRAIRELYGRWKFNADLMTCQECGCSVIATRMHETAHHAAGCKNEGERNPWLQLVELLSRLAAAGSAGTASEPMFYLQDSRGYVGNDVLWWAKDGKGYTTDLSKAHIYTKAEAVAQHSCRPSDIPWPKDYIDAKTRPAVDMQYIRRDEALEGTGIVLRKPQQPKKETIRCYQCGRFLSEQQLWAGECPKCGADNRP